MVKTVNQVLHFLLPAAVRQEVKRLLLGYPRICPQLHAWAKTHPEHVNIIKEHWGAHRRKRNLPKSAGEEKSPNCFLEHTEYPLYEKTLFRFQNLIIRGAEGVLFLPDGTVSHQTGWAPEHVTETDAYRKRWKGKEVFKKGNYSTLILHWGLGYYHWFNDVLSTLHENLELMPDDTVFLVPKGFGNTYQDNFYLKTLQALGISEKRVVEFDGTYPWKLENFWWQPPASHDHTPGAMQWIGESISRSIPRIVDEKPVKIYISRKFPSARVVINESEIIPVLKDAGFVIWQLEELPFEEQVRLFRNAELVVAPHGAGLTNLIFSKPGTRVVEIQARGHERRYYWTLCEELGFEYRFYLGEPEFPGRRGEPDIFVNSDQILSALKEFIEYL